MSNTELVTEARRQITENGTTDSGGMFWWAIMYGALADALEAAGRRADAAEKEMHARELHHFESEEALAAARATIQRVLNLIGDIGPEARRMLTELAEKP